MTSLPQIAAVILTYNSHQDLSECLSCLVKQRGVDLRIIVVDNHSEALSCDKMIQDFVAITGSNAIMDADNFSEDRSQFAYFLKSDRNAGYSAGNNVGARFALASGCESVLIVNPDVRITNEYYISKLAENLAVEKSNAIAASRIVNLNGEDENPMVEPSYWKEVAWPLRMILSRFGSKRPINRNEDLKSGFVRKVSGSCFLISKYGLQKIGFFDEKVFLYCEESILSAQLQDQGLKIHYDDTISALHAHVASSKGNELRRYINWDKARAYYHENYTGNGYLRRILLSASRKIILLLVSGRGAMRKNRAVLHNILGRKL